MSSPSKHLGWYLIIQQMVAIVKVSLILKMNGKMTDFGTVFESCFLK